MLPAHLLLKTYLFVAFFYSSFSLATCWRLAEETYGIDARLLHAIAVAESSLVADVKNINSNGTYDTGLMQINSIHLPRLKALGVTESMLITNPCVSLMVGASILSDMIARYGYGWEAVGAYNAGTSKNRQELRRKYAIKISKIYTQNTGRMPW